MLMTNGVTDFHASDTGGTNVTERGASLVCDFRSCHIQNYSDQCVRNIHTHFYVCQLETHLQRESCCPVLSQRYEGTCNEF